MSKENIDDKLKRLQDERTSDKKGRDDVAQELEKIGERLKHLQEGQKKRQQELDTEQKRQNDRSTEK